MQKIEGKCPRCGSPVEDTSEESLVNMTGKELHSLECTKCDWETVIEVEPDSIIKEVKWTPN